MPPRLADFCILEIGFYHVGQVGLEPLTSDDPYAMASKSARIAGMKHHAWPLFKFKFYFFSEMRSYYVVKAGLELLGTSAPSIFASPSAGITGVSHCAPSW